MAFNHDTLLFRRKNASHAMSPEETAAADGYCGGYIDFLNKAKTERETVDAAVALAEKHGFVPWQRGMELVPGSNIYVCQRKKALILCSAGKFPLSGGLSIVASHVDSPRLDFKMRPLYEDSSLAFFDTHYYGDIKAYQWTGIPLALHGCIVCKDGREIRVRVGEDAGDPCFFIADLLPHLGKEQMERQGKDVVRNEDLDIVAGLRAFPGESGEGSVKLNILRILNDMYGTTEEDLVSAEISAVPAFPARDLGLDRSMVGGYGQDDKVCAYPALTALFSLARRAAPQDYTACVVLADKEETGSLGTTGMQSSFFRDAVSNLAGNAAGEVFSHSLCLSADVNTAWYPLYRDAFDPHGEARLNHGVVLFRYWGRRGKENTNDADAETTAALRAILDGAGILWQTGEGGKVDGGESGTLSRFFAALDIPTIDLGVPLLSMHSPFEGAAKADIYMAHRAFAAFFERSAPGATGS